MKFVVDRSTWFRGQGDEESRLLKENGMRCCIGFCGQQLGIHDAELVGCGNVQSTTWGGRNHLREVWAKAGFCSEDGKCDVPDVHFEEEWVLKAYQINDSESLIDTERERQLKDLFVANGHTIEFVDSTPAPREALAGEKEDSDG